MPRNRPGRIRAGQRPRHRPHAHSPLAYRPAIAGLSSRAHAEVARIERSRSRLWPGVTARAVLVWADFVRHPYRRLWVANDGDCGVWECCPDPHEARGFLETVALGMSGRRGRELRRILARLDAEY